MIKVTDYKVLGRLPELLVFDNGEAVRTAEDWEKRREEIYRTVVELQYGTMPPAPEFLEVEVICNHQSLSCKIYTGRRGKPISFYMKVILPQNAKGKKCPIIVDGDACFDSYLSGYHPHLYADHEMIFPLTDEDLEAVNAALRAHFLK